MLVEYELYPCNAKRGYGYDAAKGADGGADAGLCFFFFDVCLYLCPVSDCYKK